MDNLTHSLTGVVMSRAGLARRHGPGTTALLVVASNLPDVDVLCLLGGPLDAHLMRRSLTHSVFGVPLLAVLLALAWRWRRSGRSLPALFGLTLLGAGVHVFMDLLNSYGVVLFFPASRERFELAWTFIIDLAIWAILLAPLLAAGIARLLRRGPVGERPYQASATALALYLGLCAFGHWRGERLLSSAVEQRGLRPEFQHVFPEALGPHRFRGVAREGDTYRVFLVHAWTGRVEEVATVRTDADLPDVEAVRRTEEGRRLEWFFKAPVWIRHEDAREVEVYDLRFSSAVLDRGRPFGFRLPLPP